MSWTIILLLITTYIFVSGVTIMLTRSGLRRRCVYCSGDKKSRFNSYGFPIDCWHNYAYVPFGMFWPVGIPLLLGLLVGSIPQQKQAMQAHRRKAELAQACHDADVAEQKQREAQALERELAVHGLLNQPMDEAQDTYADPGHHTSAIRRLLARRPS